MNDNILLTEQKDGVALITLNRPEVMNSFNFALLHALQAKITDIRFDTGIRVVIITGSGDRAFCSGADLKERATLSPIQVKEYIYTIRNLLSAIEGLNNPVIAAVNGVALGGGTDRDRRRADPYGGGADPRTGPQYPGRYPDRTR